MFYMLGIVTCIGLIVWGAFCVVRRLVMLWTGSNKEEATKLIQSCILQTLYTFLFILHKKACILAICAMVYKVTTTPKHLLMGENCVISGSMHVCFQSERYTK